MSNFFNNLLKRISLKKDSERQTKEEEDVLRDIGLNFELVTNTRDNQLNRYIKNLTIGNIPIER